MEVSKLVNKALGRGFDISGIWGHSLLSGEYVGMTHNIPKLDTSNVNDGKHYAYNGVQMKFQKARVENADAKSLAEIAKYISQGSSESIHSVFEGDVVIINREKVYFISPGGPKKKIAALVPSVGLK